MKTIQARITAGLLITAASLVPVFAQGRENGYSRGEQRGDRGRQQQGEVRGGNRRGDNARGDVGGGQGYRQQGAGNQGFRDQGYRDQGYRGQGYRDQGYRNQGYRQQVYRQPSYQAPRYSQQQYGPGNGYRGAGGGYGYGWPGGGMRWSDRGGYRGQYIPQARFYQSFGRQNYFRFGRPIYSNGYARFSYGGYGFQMLDTVPAYWGDNWYDSGDVYLDYVDDGYYLYNRRYPSVGIAIGINF